MLLYELARPQLSMKQLISRNITKKKSVFYSIVILFLIIVAFYQVNVNIDYIQENSKVFYENIMHEKLKVVQNPTPTTHQQLLLNSNIKVNNGTVKNVNGDVKRFGSTLSNEIKNIELQLMAIKKKTESLLRIIKPPLRTSNGAVHKLGNAQPSIKINEIDQEKVPIKNQTNPSKQPTSTLITTRWRTVRPDSCKGCFERPYKFIINSPNICLNLTKNSSGQVSLPLVILITTVSSHVDNRNAIRETWASLTKNNTHPKLRYGFFLGHTSEKVTIQMQEERNKYNDIIMQSFHDSYKNLTLKTLMMLEWTERFCPKAENIMKTDDDIYVDAKNVLELAQKNDHKSSIIGSCSIHAGVIRNKNSKWYVSFRQYPHSNYPGFCSGTGYVISKKVARDILRISPSVPFFYLEDVYMAICADKLKYKLHSIGGFNSGGARIPKRGCGVYAQKNFYTAHYFSPSLLRNHWAKCGPKTL